MARTAEIVASPDRGARPWTFEKHSKISSHSSTSIPLRISLSRPLRLSSARLAHNEIDLSLLGDQEHVRSGTQKRDVPLSPHLAEANLFYDPNNLVRKLSMP